MFQYLTPEARETGYQDSTIFSTPISRSTSALKANSYYFGHPEWGRNYLAACHQYAALKVRWQAVLGNWQDKVVVDIGCGPGNLYAALRECCGAPRLLIGVDVSQGALAIAKELGYAPVLADAQQLPFISGFADIVAINAALHHCDDMELALQEAARLVRPGGILIVDHEPQRGMWNDNAIAKFIWNVRLPIYRLLKRGGHSTAEEQFWSTATEAHHKPGDGVTPELFTRILEPLGFTVNLYPHNHHVGTEVFQGERGRAAWRVRLAQRLCGVNPDSIEGALVMMCVAIRSINIANTEENSLV